MKKIYVLIFTIISFCSTAQIEGTWKLAQSAFAIGCGPNQGDGGWWSNSIGDLTARDCLFDDSIKFESGVIIGGGIGGPMYHYMDGNTWLESFQGVTSEQCGAPVAPHDGATAAMWSFANNQLTLTGVGAHLGLPKVINGGELSSASDTVPNTRVYEITVSPNGDTLTADIQSAGGGSGWWRFVYTKTTVAPPANYSVTLHLDANNITVGAEGIYAGGGVLGDALAVPMTDANGDGIWEGVGTFPAAGGNYIFLNSPTNGGDWGTKEDLNGLPCADPNNWNDRIMPALTADSTVCAIFASCDPCQTPPTGLLNNKENKLNVFPNPSSGLLNISSNNEISNLAIYDILGKEVFSQNINNINSILNIENFINGVYFLKLNFKDKTSTTLKISKE